MVGCAAVARSFPAPARRCSTPSEDCPVSRLRPRIILLSIVVAVLVWLVDTSIYLAFHYADAAIWSQVFSLRELATRVAASVAIVTFGLLIVRLLGRRAQEKTLEALAEVDHEKAKSQALIDALGEAVSISGLDYRILYENHVMQDLMGSHVGELCYRAYETRDDVCDGCALQRTFARRTIESSERFRRIAGDNRCLQVTTSPLTDSDGNLVAGMKIMRDVTDQRRNQERLKRSVLEKELLLQEVHHRVRNNLQLILSLLSLQSATSTSGELVAFLRESKNRIRSMALLHEQLCGMEDVTQIDLATYTRNLVDGLLEAHGIEPDRVRVRVDTAGVSVPLDVATPCALILNELVSNAIEHGFPEGRSGEIQVMARQLTGDRPAIHMSVRDDGVGLPAEFDLRRVQSLGLQIIRNLVEQQLEGSVEVLTAPSTEFRIEIPLPRSAASPKVVRPPTSRASARAPVA